MSFGVETWCADRLVAGRYARGRTLVALAIYRRLTTPRGSLMPIDFDGDEEELSYGLDLEEFIGAVGGERAAAAIPAMVRAEILKDDRVAEVDVASTLVRNPDGLDEITIALDVLLVDETTTFPLTLTASAQAVALLGVPTE